MSLKAKMEAVIYAAEEPVTPAQLVGLLGQEAQAALDAADALQGQLALLTTSEAATFQDIEAGDQDALNAETLGTEDLSVAATEDDPMGQSLTESNAEPSPVASPQADGSPSAGDAAAEASEAGPANAEASGTATEDTLPERDSAPTSAEPSGAAEPSAAEQRARERRLREYMRSLLDELVAEYANGDRGLEIREVAGGYRFATKPEYHDAVRGFVRSLKPPLKLSLQALETLAVVAYKQPVTAPEVSEIRGVDSSGALGSLVGRKLVATAGRKQVIGRPILYKTTKEFLLRFGLKDLNELPSIEEFERLASEVNEAVQEEIPLPSERLDEMKPAGSTGDAPRNAEPMRDVHAAQADGIPDEQADAEPTTEAPDGPGEFTGDETVPPADNASIDGRLSGLPPSYDQGAGDGMDSPALDAEVQASAQTENTGSDD